MRRRGTVNHVTTVGVHFAGDPAGAALTAALRRVYDPSLAGRLGFVYAGDKGSPEHSWNGALPTNPQAGLLPRNSQLATPLSTVYRNGPVDLANSISAQAGQMALDARMRMLANKVGR